MGRAHTQNPGARPKGRTQSHGAWATFNGKVRKQHPAADFAGKT